MGRACCAFGHFAKARTGKGGWPFPRTGARACFAYVGGVPVGAGRGFISPSPRLPEDKGLRPFDPARGAAPGPRWGSAPDPIGLNGLVLKRRTG
ncbi:hypothetical protein GCM10010307_61200 [Streptomyces vastus]|uniref:Uncharacterized protein n=1 Tax=Streptomyces vastus TaxID=285451 RepID=A0ABP6DWC1_9ACTN